MNHVERFKVDNASPLTFCSYVDEEDYEQREDNAETPPLSDQWCFTVRGSFSELARYVLTFLRSKTSNSTTLPSTTFLFDQVEIFPYFSEQCSLPDTLHSGQVTFVTSAPHSNSLHPHFLTIMSSSMAGTMIINTEGNMHVNQHNSPLPRIIYPGKGPLIVYTCCQCHHLRNKGDAKCTNCKYVSPSPCLPLWCIFSLSIGIMAIAASIVRSKLRPQNGAPTRVSLGSSCLSLLPSLLAQEMPVISRLPGTGMLTAFSTVVSHEYEAELGRHFEAPQPAQAGSTILYANTVPLDGNEGFVRRRDENPNGLKWWIFILAVVVVSLCLALSYQAHKYERELAVLRRDRGLLCREWGIEEMEALEESRRLFQAYRELRNAGG